MSRLDSFINRMTAQRDILNHIRDALSLPDGAVLEVGLGNGRTYSHLRENFGDRRIVVFDRQFAAHKTLAPEPEDFIEGEIRETGQGFVGKGAALVHSDIGTGYPEKDAITLQWLPDMVAGMLTEGGIAVSGLPLSHPQLEELPRLPNVEEGRYFYYRKTV
ncbi:class I SAM-dependent methyltransferase [Neorhizobium sp. JUb45]|uniref:class I SAM-dependent methyltransferase n=1 Tax=unclassified Neorhizobium TaxID=2629175 RepID=UPI001049872C|nr:class I SAM-dependent methyltransferase [Neorhizobium sp. JUb45]TCQ99743.1 S-adenosylmethionine-dependent methyltransferase [Neorhizobium sp. JUb45]